MKPGCSSAYNLSILAFEVEFLILASARCRGTDIFEIKFSLPSCVCVWVEGCSYAIP